MKFFIFLITSIILSSIAYANDTFYINAGRTWACFPMNSQQLKYLGIDEIRGFNIDIGKNINKNFSIEIGITKLKHWDDAANKFNTSISKCRLDYDMNQITSTLRGKYIFNYKYIKPCIFIGVGYTEIEEWFTYITDYVNNITIYEQSQTIKDNGLCIEMGIGLDIHLFNNFSMKISTHYFKGNIQWLDLNHVKYMLYAIKLQYYF